MSDQPGCRGQLSRAAAVTARFMRSAMLALRFLPGPGRHVPRRDWRPNPAVRSQRPDSPTGSRCRGSWASRDSVTPHRTVPRPGRRSRPSPFAVHHHPAVLEGTHVLRGGEIAPLRTGACPTEAGVISWAGNADLNKISAIVLEADGSLSMLTTVPMSPVVNTRGDSGQRLVRVLLRPD